MARCHTFQVSTSGVTFGHWSHREWDPKVFSSIESRRRVSRGQVCTACNKYNDYEQTSKAKVLTHEHKLSPFKKKTSSNYGQACRARQNTKSNLWVFYQVHSRLGPGVTMSRQARQLSKWNSFWKQHRDSTWRRCSRHRQCTTMQDTYFMNWP